MCSQLRSGWKRLPSERKKDMIAAKHPKRPSGVFPDQAKPWLPACILQLEFFNHEKPERSCKVGRENVSSIWTEVCHAPSSPCTVSRLVISYPIAFFPDRSFQTSAVALSRCGTLKAPSTLQQHQRCFTGKLYVCPQSCPLENARFRCLSMIHLLPILP